jgi:hypothetical protein
MPALPSDSGSHEEGLGFSEDNSVNWRGDLTHAGSGSFEKHPLHQTTYPWSLAVLKFCQKLITNAESSVNEDGEIEFNSWPPIEALIDLRKHVMAVSAKLAGGLSSENRTPEEIKVSLEFLGMAYNHLGIAIFLLRNLLLERTKTDKEEKLKWILNQFLSDGVTIEDSLRTHMERLKQRVWKDNDSQ